MRANQGTKISALHLAQQTKAYLRKHSKASNAFYFNPVLPLTLTPAIPVMTVIVESHAGMHENVPIIYKTALKNEVRIGRMLYDESFTFVNDITLPDEDMTLSRAHCKIACTEGGAIYVEDLGSAYGTYVEVKGEDQIGSNEIYLVESNWSVITEKAGEGLIVKLRKGEPYSQAIYLVEHCIKGKNENNEFKIGKKCQVTIAAKLGKWVIKLDKGDFGLWKSVCPVKVEPKFKGGRIRIKSGDRIKISKAILRVEISHN